MVEENEIKIVSQPITIVDLKSIAEKRFGDMVKAVVDIEREIMAVGGEMHADEESVLLSDDSVQANLWGINLYVDLAFPDMVEFDSLINIRPWQNNRSRGVEDESIRQRIFAVVKNLIKL